MGDFFIGEIRLFAFDWAPYSWALAQGQILNIQQNQALYSLLGPTYGGDGINTFGLPDFRGRVPRGQWPLVKGKVTDGEEGVVLTADQFPTHTHALNVDTTTGTALVPASTSTNTHNFLASSGPDNVEKKKHDLFGAFVNPGVALNTGSVVNSGGGAAHPNIQPSVVANYCIATAGLYPSRP